jgi:hypothetical protein
MVVSACIIELLALPVGLEVAHRYHELLEEAATS